MRRKLVAYFILLTVVGFVAAVYFYSDNGFLTASRMSIDATISSAVVSSSSGPIVQAAKVPLDDVLCTRDMFERTRLNGSRCICLTDSRRLVSRKFSVRQMAEYIRDHRTEQFQCAMTVNPNGRLGNLMGEYATLYALAKLNDRPAFLPPAMANTMRSYFKVSMPSLNSSDLQELEYLWTNVEVRRWMEPSYAHLSEMFVRLIGPPYSWTFYEPFANDVAREFTFHDAILSEAQSMLRAIAHQSGHSTPNSTVTFIGVHARRTDAIGWIGNYHGTVADASFYRKAMDHFRQKHRDAVFVVASDDMAWCRRNIESTANDVFFHGEGNQNNPIRDLALLANCNHSIISIGTYGYWSAYLAGGDTVYLSNYTTSDSHYLRKFSYETMYLPHWKGIS